MRMCRLCAFERNDDTMTHCRQCGAELAPIVDETELEQDSAWFHYLQVPGVGTIELVPGRALKMGRDARSELVIPRGSQDQIATIFWTDDYDEATVKEFGAAEGVKVDGVKLTGTRTLKGGEEVVVGTLRMVYLRKAKPIKGALDAEKIGKKVVAAGQPAAPAAATPAPSGATRTRAVKKAAVVVAKPATVCMAFERNKASGTLRVMSQRGRGFVTVVQGAPQHAAFGGLAGPSALLAILALPQGRCQMVPGVPQKGKGPRLEGTFTSVVNARAAKVAAQKAARPASGLKAPPRIAPPPRPALRPAQPTPRPGPQAPRPPGVVAPRPGQPTPVPRQPTPPPRPGQPTPVPRPGQPTPAPRPAQPTPAPRPGVLAPRPAQPTPAPKPGQPTPAPPRPGQPSPRPPGAPPPPPPRR